MREPAVCDGQQRACCVIKSQTISSNSSDARQASDAGSGGVGICQRPSSIHTADNNNKHQKNARAGSGTNIVPNATGATKATRNMRHTLTYCVQVTMCACVSPHKVSWSDGWKMSREPAVCDGQQRACCVKGQTISSNSSDARQAGDAGSGGVGICKRPSSTQRCGQQHQQHSSSNNEMLLLLLLLYMRIMFIAATLQKTEALWTSIKTSTYGLVVA